MAKLEKITGLVGRSFHVFGDTGAIERQGTVLAAVGPDHYLIRYYDMILGHESTLAVVPISDMACPPKHSRSPWSWQFYVDDEHMIEWHKTWGASLKRHAA